MCLERVHFDVSVIGVASYFLTESRCSLAFFSSILILG